MRADALRNTSATWRKNWLGLSGASILYRLSRGVNRRRPMLKASTDTTMMTVPTRPASW